MILNFSIKNFRSINDEITLSFEPVLKKNEKKEDYKYYINQIGETKILKTAIIYGPNASGKTNIIKALYFLRNFVLYPPIDKTIRITELNNHYYKPFAFQSVRENSLLSLDFFVNGYRYLYEIEFNIDKVIYEELRVFKSRKSSKVFKRYDSNDNIIVEISKVNSAEKKLLVANTLPNMLLLSSFLKLNINFPEIDSVLKWFKFFLKESIFPTTVITGWIIEQMKNNNFKKSVVIDILKSADFTIGDYELKERDLSEQELVFLKALADNFLKDLQKEDINNQKMHNILFKHIINNKSYYLDFFEDESRGTKRFFELAHILSLLMEQPVIVPIDEIESSLHPDLLKHFLVLFFLHSKPGSQLILTTHSRELLKEMDILRHDFIWFTEKKEDGSTDLFALTDFGTNVIRDTSSVYNKYKIGKLGAVPNLKMFVKQNIDNGEKHGEKREKK